jgi:hypothetical protein
MRMSGGCSVGDGDGDKGDKPDKPKGQAAEYIGKQVSEYDVCQDREV